MKRTWTLKSRSRNRRRFCTDTSSARAASIVTVPIVGGSLWEIADRSLFLEVIVETSGNYREIAARRDTLRENNADPSLCNLKSALALYERPPKGRNLSREAAPSRPDFLKMISPTCRNNTKSRLLLSWNAFTCRATDAWRVLLFGARNGAVHCCAAQFRRRRRALSHPHAGRKLYQFGEYLSDGCLIESASRRCLHSPNIRPLPNAHFYVTNFEDASRCARSANV